MQEERKPQEIKLLDFQLICHGPPVFDLSYCFYSGACEETLNKLDEYLQVYHSSLSDTLEEFGLNSGTIYSFKTLKEEWKHFCKYALPIGMFLWRIKLVDKNAIPDFSKGDKGDVKIAEEMKDVFKNRMRELFFHMYSNDYL